MRQDVFLKEKMDQTKDMVLNRVLIVILFVMTFGVIVSLIRISQTGFKFNYGIQILLAIIMVLLYVFRNRLTTRTKGIIFLASIYTLGLSGMFSFGLYGFGWAYFIPASSLAFLYFNRRTGWVLSLSSLLVLIVIGILFNKGILQFVPEKQGYMHSLSMWLNMIITACLISILITMFWNNMYSLLSNTFTHINYQQEDMKKLNADLIGARDKALESDRLKSSFLANISHEIRTPLNIIIGYSDMLTQTESAEERAELHEVIKTNSSIMLKMVNDIVDFSKIETNNLSLTKTEFWCNEVLDNVIQDLKLKIQKEVSLEIEKEDCMILCDKDRFYQIIYNLVDNALKFTQSGKIKIKLYKSNNNIHFRIADTGIGITPEEHAKIFDRFYKVDKFTQGSGLGLSLSKSIANYMGGDITMKSELGKGSVFEFFIPCPN